MNENKDIIKRKKKWFNYSDGTHLDTSVSIWYPLLKKCQLYPKF